VKNKTYAITINICMLLLYVAAITLVISGGVSKTGFLWIIPFPLLAFYLLSLKLAIFWVISLFSTLLVITLMQLLLITGLTAYSNTELSLDVSALVIVTILIYFYQLEIVKTSKLLKTKTKALVDNNLKLEKKSTLLEEALENQMSAVADLEKTKLATLNLLEDVEEEKEINKIQAINLQKFKQVVEESSEMVVITDKQGTTIYANRATEKTTGYNAKEIIGVKAGKLWGGLMTQKFYEKLWHQIKTKKKIFKAKMKNKTKKGIIYTVEVIIYPILGDNKEIEFYVSVSRNITRQEKIDRMKTEFISLASHQLRTPLSAMRWFLEMLLEGDLGKLNSKQKKVVIDINKSNHRMIDLVSMLLNVSRIETGRIIVEPKSTQISELAKETIADFKPKLKQNNHKLKIKVEPNLPKVSIDPNLIRQVFTNLLDNSIKYSPKGTNISVDISRDKKFITAKVQDEGFGIPAECQEHIFERFYRATNIELKNIEGNGLGLYLCKQIIEVSGGEIGFNSEVGKGTTFWFSVPLAGSVSQKGEVKLNEIT
jgi:PAS domain S-box-containing protein